MKATLLILATSLLLGVSQASSQSKTSFTLSNVQLNHVDVLYSNSNLAAALSSIRLKNFDQLESGIKSIRSTEWAESIRHAVVDPSYSRNGCKSPLDDWSRQLVDEMGVETASDLLEYGVDLLAFAYKLIVDMNEDDEYFGVNGKETGDLVANHDASVEFWGTADVDTGDVILLGVHGTDLMDYSNMYATLELLVEEGTSHHDVREAVFAYQQFIGSLPHGFENPLLTANALAAAPTASDELLLGKSVQDSILVGDGIIDYLRHMNLGREGPEYVHSHEFAHHLQFELGIGLDGIDEEDAEDSRRIELMADAFSAYYLAHEEGAGMSSDRMREVQKAAHSTGDCNTSDEGHHGTPKQRECAAVWGANLAASSTEGNDIMHPQSLRDEFDFNLQSILDLDESACQSARQPEKDNNTSTTSSEDTEEKWGFSPLAIIVTVAAGLCVTVITAVAIASRCWASKELQAQAEMNAKGPMDDDEDWTNL